MSVQVGQLYQTLELKDDKFNRGLMTAKSNVGGLSKALEVGLAGAAVAGAAVAGRALTRLGSKSLHEFRRMETGMAEVMTLLPDATEQATSDMTENLQEFNMEMGVTADKSVPALYQAISAGVPEDNVFEFLETAQKAAKGGVTDLTTAVDGLSSVVNSYGDDVVDVNDVSDDMFTAVRLGKITFEEMSGTLSDVVPIASAAGIEFSNITAALATTTSQGISAEKSTTQLRQALAELGKEGSQASDAFQSVAGESFPEFIKSGGNLQEAMQLMEKAAKDNNTSIQNLFANIRGGQAALALTGKASETFAKNLSEMEDNTGATDRAFATMMDTSQTWQDRLQAAIQVVYQEIGDILAPMFDKFMKMVVERMPNVIDKIRDFGDSLEDENSTIRKFGQGIYLVAEIAELAIDSIMDKFAMLFNIGKIVNKSLNLSGKIFERGMKRLEEQAIKGVRAILRRMEHLSKIPGPVGDAYDGLVENNKGALSEVLMEWSVLDVEIDKLTGSIGEDFKDFGGMFGDWSSNAGKNIQNILDAFDNLMTNSDNMTKNEKENLKEQKKSWEDYVKEIQGGADSEDSDEDEKESNRAKKAEETKNKVLQIVEDRISQIKQLEDEAYMKYAETQLDSVEMMKLRRDREVAEYREKGADTYELEQYWQDKIDEEKQAQLDKEKERQQEELQAYGETQRKKSEIRSKAHQERLEFNREWGQRLFEQNATEMERLQREKEKAIADAEEKGAATWAIEQYYAEKERELMNKREEEEKEAFRSRFDFIRTGFEEAFTSILQGTESVTDAFGNLWNSILDQVMSKLAEMAASKVFEFVVSGGSGGGGLLGGIGDIFGGIFHNGGTVPGPIGEERLILAQGGETVTPIGRSQRGNGGGYKSANISLNIDGRQVARAIEAPLADRVRIKGGVKV